VGLTLVEVRQATEGVLLGAVEPSNERLGALHFSCVPAALEGGLVDWGPLATSPDGALHLAALGHLKTVEGVAVGAEEAGHKVVATAELATLGVKLLPPVLMVAVSDANGGFVCAGAFTWLLALGKVNVVERITTTVSAETSEKPLGGANRPAPLVK